MKTTLFALIAIPMGMLVLSLQTIQASDTDVHARHHAVEIIAEDYALDAPDQIPSGWTNIVYENDGKEPHLLVIARLPDGISFDDYATDLALPFNDAWYAIRDDGMSQDDAIAQLGAELPEWFPDYRYMGGSGLISPGKTNTITVDLEPGTYVLECYVKTEDGEIHAIEGMVRELLVTNDKSSTTAPEADIEITLFNDEMEFDGELRPGRQTIAVHVEEQPEAALGHNVHVVGVDAETDVDELIRWMNWYEPDGMLPPSPAEFIGGMQLLPIGGTAYFTVDVEPGEYLFMSELTAHLGVMQRVRVAP